MSRSACSAQSAGSPAGEQTDHMNAIEHSSGMSVLPCVSRQCIAALLASAKVHICSTNHLIALHVVLQMQRALSAHTPRILARPPAACPEHGPQRHPGKPLELTLQFTTCLGRCMIPSRHVRPCAHEQNACKAASSAHASGRAPQPIAIAVAFLTLHLLRHSPTLRCADLRALEPARAGAGRV